MLRQIVLWALAAACALPAFAATAPRAANGAIDLRGWDFVEDGIARLEGEWKLHPGRFIDPSQPAEGASLPVAVPGNWNAQLGGPHGHASYELLVQCGDARGLAILVPMAHSAMRLYVNGRIVARQGSPSEAAGAAQPASVRQVARVEEARCPLRIVAHVSNHDHRLGGMVMPLRLGSESQVQRQRTGGLVLDASMVGGLYVFGLLPLMFFLVRRKDRMPLWFALFAITLAVHISFSKERLLQAQWWPQANWEAMLRTEAATACLAMVLLILFVRGLYPKDLHERVAQALIGAGLALAGALALLPVALGSHLEPLRQAYTAAAGLLVVAFLVRAAWRQKSSYPVLLSGMVLVSTALLLDVLAMNHDLRRAIAPIGGLVFLLAPMILLARRFARALRAEELRSIEQVQRADMLFESTRAGSLDWDVPANVLTYSTRFREMLGYPPDFDTSAWPSFFSLVHPDEQKVVYELFRTSLRDFSVKSGIKRNESWDYRLRCMDGSYIWVRGQAISLTDAEGKILRYVCSFINISDRMALEETLRESRDRVEFEQRRLDLVVRAAQVGIVDWDGHTHATWYSPRFRELRGYPPDTDTSGWPDYFKVMIHPDDRARVTRRFRGYVMAKDDRPEFYDAEEYRILRADGSHVWVQVMGICVRDEAGFVTRFIAAVADITERHVHEEALRESVRLREEVERISRHDLKTPLNSIIAVPRLLREERGLSREEEELLGIVERAGYRILSMVNLSLDLYKMEQGTYVFRPDAVDVADLVSKIMLDMHSHAESKGVSLRFVHGARPPGMDPAAPLYAWAEELLCYSMFANLLKNAVEASPEGGRVTITLSADEMATLAVHNRGVVPESIREHFFTKYATLGKASGTGLGTYSARLMARMQEGDITMRTSEADGTTLTIRLRLAPTGELPAAMRRAAERTTRRLPHLARLPSLRVLLVDDDEYNLLIVRRYLDSPQLDVDTAINGRMALEKMALAPPDVLVMDLDMPVMGGMEAISEWRRREQAAGGARVLGIALSSHDDEETRQQALAAGFDFYLSKPVTRDVLQRTLAGLVEGQGGAVAAVDAPASAAADDAVRIDPALAPMIEGFLASRRAVTAEMAAALEAGDREALRKHAHKLAGSFALYGFTRAVRESRAIHDAAKDGDTASLAARVAALKAHLETVRAVAADAPAPEGKAAAR